MVDKKTSIIYPPLYCSTPRFLAGVGQFDGLVKATALCEIIKCFADMKPFVCSGRILIHSLSLSAPLLVRKADATCS